MFRYTSSNQLTRNHRCKHRILRFFDNLRLNGFAELGRLTALLLDDAFNDLDLLLMRCAVDLGLHCGANDLFVALLHDQFGFLGRSLHEGREK